MFNYNYEAMKNYNESKQSMDCWFTRAAKLEQDLKIEYVLI